MDIMLTRIKELVDAKRGTRKELASNLGISPNTITDWWSGKNKSYPKYAKQIADFFDVSVEYLYGNADEKSAKKEATLSDGFRSNLVDDIMSLSESDAALVAAYVAGLKSKH